jgi:site-specific DNA recombinase
MSTNAVAYLRVSGKSQVEGDGFPRQQQAIERVAEKLGITLTHTFQDEGVSGTTHWGDRPAFAEMIALMLDNPTVKTLIVENLSRLAREYVIQDAILLFLASKGIDLISADTGENITEAVRSDPMKKALIQMQAVFSELDKNSLVRKLRAARQRKKEQTGRCEGQLPYGAKSEEQVVLQAMLALRHEGRTVRTIAALLNETGHPTRNGRPWTYGVVAKILARHGDTDAVEEAEPTFE